jgi:hypothetical protein
MFVEASSHRLQEITADPRLQLMAPEERHAAVAQTTALYDRSKTYVAPVIAAFADSLLREAGDRKVIFAARDGRAPYVAATALSERFHYPGRGPHKVAYAYLTRKVVNGSNSATLQRHMEQLGIQPTDEGLIADIGMYGTMQHQLNRLLPGFDHRYLISRNISTPGYADETSNRQMRSMESIIGNVAVHFLEDTFSGPIKSPSRLIEQGGVLVPDTHDQGYPPAISMKRSYALAAIHDYVHELTAPPAQPAAEAVANLDAFLLQPENYRDIMVPHER